MRRLVPRFSLRTLVVFMLLVTAGTGLWWHWEPWELEAGRTLGVPVSPGDAAAKPLPSPDGKLAAELADNDDVLVRDVADGKLLHRIKNEWAMGGAIEGLFLGRFEMHWSLDSTYIAVRRLMPGVRVYEARTGKCIDVNTPQDRGAQALALFPDGKRALMLLDDGSLWIWDARAWQPLDFVSEGVPVPFDQLPAAATSYGWVRVMNNDTAVLIDAANAYHTFYRRRRPEWWWGVFWLWEFWLTVVFAGVFVWSVWRDRRALGAGTSE